MKIIKQRERKTKVRYYLSFEWSDTPGSGFNFDCDEKGNVLLTDANSGNYQKCISGEYDVIAEGLQKREWSYIEHAIGKCICGEEVILDGFTNTCDKCDRDYNSQGDLLAPRSQWGEETGEHWSECY